MIRFLLQSKIGMAIALCALAIVLAGALAIVSLRRQVASAQLAELNAKARADSTHAAEMKAKDSAKILGDSLRAVQILIVQEKIKTDQKDRALNLQSQALIRAIMTVDRMSGVIASSSNVKSVGSSANPDSVRVAEFHERKEPFTLDAKASLPRTGKASLAYSIMLDTARAELRLGCADRERGSLVRAATATAITNDWLKLKFSRVQQSPDVCNSGAVRDRSFFEVGFGLTVGYGALYSPSEKDQPARERIHHGFGAMAGISIFHR